MAPRCDKTHPDGPRPDVGRRPGAPVFAALDLGTNNCRLLVARRRGSGFHVIDAFSRVVCLGEGVAASGRLSDEAMTRALSALKVCADKIRRRKATHIRAIATEACRQAINGSDFIRRVRDVTGVPLSVIGSCEEARLAVAGCAPLVDPAAQRLVVFDIGGGSTELARVDLRGVPPYQKRALLQQDSQALRDRAQWESLPVGVVTLHDQFAHISGDQDRYRAMRRHVDDLLGAAVRQEPSWTMERLAGLQLLGTSGTITTLAGLYLGLERYNRADVDGIWLSLEALRDVSQRLVALDDAARALLPCVGADRAKLLLAGTAILDAITSCWPARRVRVADRGLREGIIYGLMRGQTHQTRQHWRTAQPAESPR